MGQKGHGNGAVMLSQVVEKETGNLFTLLRIDACVRP
jgi:hypothetical protein